MITVKAPGKLYIAGEYAVVESGFPAILVAVDQFVTVTIEKSETVGSIISKQYQENSIHWFREGKKLVVDNRDNPFHYILSGIRLTEKVALERGKELQVFDLNINSELDSPSGKKFGLGSSAAVTVATIKAVSEFYQLHLSKMELYKLAAIAHLDVQGNGSLGDIAASVYGGWIAYRSFNKEWLTVMRRKVSLDALLAMHWPQLDIQLLTPPSDLKLIIGWSGSPASTSNLVDQVTISKAEKEKAYDHFLEESRACLTRMIAGFKNQDLSSIQTEIRMNRKLLKNLSETTGVNIETPVLTELCDIAETFNGAAKTSGAGGGDCGIVVINRSIDTRPLYQDWESKNILPLDLTVHHVN